MTVEWPALSRRAEVIIVTLIVLLAFILRSVGHHHAPDGWREDELSNALVVSQHVREGDIRLYYDDASGHEGLYHWLQALTMTIFGPGVWGIRGVSILAGTVTVLLLYVLARQLFDWPAALIASLALAVSFWSLIYSRSGQRHISMLVTTLTGFIFLWKAVQSARSGAAGSMRQFILAGVLTGIGFYTYFASRGIPLIVIGWGAYLALWRRDLWHKTWRGLLAMLVVSGLLAVPLGITLARQPEAEARVSELAKPIDDARAGDFSTMGKFALTTLAMFTHDGDSEVLYNVAHRPVFGPAGSALFWAGVMLAVTRALGQARDERCAFLLLWLGAGLSPGALSVPAASLGHTLLAQPPAMMFPALTLVEAGRWLRQHVQPPQTAAGTMLATALLFLVWEGIRGPYDYFVKWPADSFNRVLHHSDLHEAAGWLNAHADTQDIAIGGFLLERWDQQVMKLDLDGQDWRVRAFDPRQAALRIPGGGIAVLPEYLNTGWGVGQLGSQIPVDAPYGLYEIEEPLPGEPLVLFANGLALLDARIDDEPDRLAVTLTYQVDRTLALPPFPLLSKPPAPGQDDTPRLAIFVQLLDGSGQRIAGADGLGVDPYTLFPDDVFLQYFEIDVAGTPSGIYRLVTGLYDPSTGQRIIDTVTGVDLFDLGTWSSRQH